MPASLRDTWNYQGGYISRLEEGSRKRKALGQPSPIQHEVKRMKIYFSEEIIVLVGEEKKRYVVHKNVLRATSRFFRDCLSGKWREARQRAIPLPESVADDFDVYLTYLCEGTIDLPEFHQSSEGTGQDATQSQKSQNQAPGPPQARNADGVGDENEEGVV
ncbi:uncharacterized protein LTR77_002176 [Saxophila tyrrhenica]|uniref:BTB domain-containing protein n=1 Tax=Saxophila tyrrhenica TaxID=1690608 RepID=A0AAV9PIF7_9PEZI|nr:hypothetical protein LTR77_002176 [Saxophila tyrrhenica]